MTSYKIDTETAPDYEMNVENAPCIDLTFFHLVHHIVVLPYYSYFVRSPSSVDLMYLVPVR
jgi:hypothetical protein